MGHSQRFSLDCLGGPTGSWSSCLGIAPPTPKAPWALTEGAGLIGVGLVVEMGPDVSECPGEHRDEFRGSEGPRFGAPDNVCLERVEIGLRLSRQSSGVAIPGDRPRDGNERACRYMQLPKFDLYTLRLVKLRLRPSRLSFASKCAYLFAALA